MILEKAKELIKDKNLCNNCLGRQFAMLGTGLTNKGRGSSLKNSILLEADMSFKETEEEKELIDLAFSYDLATKTLERRKIKQKKENKKEKNPCYLCKGLFKNLDFYADQAINRLENLEFSDFLVGTKLTTDLAQREEELHIEHGSKYSENIKSEINRELGKIISKKTGKEVNFEKPDVVVVLNLDTEDIELEINPLYIYGRYMKYSREIPQCEWRCPVCEGKGCMRCDNTGYLYDQSVEEIISKPILKTTKGKKSVFHGSGREDVDVRMLGNGRPFVIEIKEPKKRDPDLNKLKNEINEKDNPVKVTDLRFVEKETVADIKQARSPKTYKATIKLPEIELRELKKALDHLEDIEVEQKTPKRISRRPQKNRKRKIFNTDLVEIKDNKAEIEIKAEAGTYIKELIHGDEGNTKPSLKDIIGKEIKCERLDVIKVHYDFN
ncbi:MAG: tRNA U54 and U55 pseudouridine synthase Pus10 [Candidatus Methanohalarchaeum thermophilum]|uniref:tRNA pseudouridine synthase Pus10 n=1 Tax=Methanohalarchaeum thermophilum TaxID=1903181 RepID=A0A1Q6DXX5_METT1|nr:MAG: tRNA U54 and U55 pseudouridine synthase Pus10 [Candidatus Methanohalarchaeum thermophilum]